MQVYLDALRHVLENGRLQKNRTGVDTIGVFGYQMRFNLRDDFPILTTKEVHWKSIVYELLWFLRGETNLKYLHDHGTKIWDAWADENGELGPIYGKQWVDWEAPDGRRINQIARAIESLRVNPTSRQIVVSAWNPADVEYMKLPPCHFSFQLRVIGNELNCHMIMRSTDIFLGLTFNLSGYALLTNMIAQVLGLKPGDLVISFGDFHIYVNHIEQVKLQITRKPLPSPKLELNPKIKDIFEFKFEDIRLVDYKFHEKIKAPVAV